MIILLLLPLLFTQSSVQDGGGASDSPVAVLSFKWVPDRQPIENAVSVAVAPAPAMIAANRTFERQKRINDPAGTRDPNADTLDGRSSELDRINREARETEPVMGFSYQVRIQNGTSKPIENIFWEYRFREIENPNNVSRKQFLCVAHLKAEKQKELQAFSLTAPTGVVSVKSLAKDSGKKIEEAVLINRVEFADGTFWQRKDWNFDEVKLTAKARDAKRMPSCRGL